MFRKKLQPLRPETCRHRSAVRKSGSTESASCALVKALTGIEGDAWCTVSRDACERCCQTFPPSLEQINPVVASLVLEVASAVINAGGTTGCNLEQAVAIRDLAVANLDVVFPDETSPRIPDGLAELALAARIPRASRRRGRRVKSWAVGVTTAPRRRPTLELCLDSLARAGWETPYLFVDSAINIPERFTHLPGTFRDAKLGAWPSYYLALLELLMRYPESDAYMIVQDDVLFDHRESVRAYLEETLWPGAPAGLVSLYCSSAYTKPEAGWHALDGSWVWGALAFVFPADLAREFVIDRQVFGHRRDRRIDGLANIDVLIGRWALCKRVPIWYPTPSLVQHIGETSTIRSSNRAEGARRADQFAGDLP